MVSVVDLTATVCNASYAYRHEIRAAVEPRAVVEVREVGIHIGRRARRPSNIQQRRPCLSRLSLSVAGVKVEVEVEAEVGVAVVGGWR